MVFPFDEDSTSGNIEAAHSLIRSVLLVDAPAITQPVRQFLRQKGWFVEEASNAGQARNLIARFKPDFVITELLLPLESGIEFCNWLKQVNSRLTAMIFSEVRLSEARNLAAWTGADAYLTKPTDPETLYRHMLRAASRVHRRTKDAETGDAGRIRFRCRCGKRISANARHAGRAINCPACSHLVQVPETAMDSSSMFRSPFAAKTDKSVVDAGIVCNHCGKSNLLSKCRSHGRYQCVKCQRRLEVSQEILEGRNLFFGPDAPATDPAAFDPLRHVFVKCDGCGKVHEYFRNADCPLPCPNCSREHSLPSIRGVPLSRAALACTGRLFEFTLSTGKRRLFLLPSVRRWMIGSSPNCPVSLRGEPLESQHCILKQTFEGPLLVPVSAGASIIINNRRVYERTILAPGDQILLGGVSLQLHGIPADRIQSTLDHIMQEVRGQQLTSDEKTLARTVAAIVQCHWQQERLRLIEKQLGTVHEISAQSSESSVVQQLSESGLYETGPLD